MLPTLRMHRFLSRTSALSIACLMGAAILALSSTASAQDNTCADGEVITSVPSWMIEQLVTLEGDVSLMDFATRAEAMANANEHGNDQGSHEISWCTSANDPRCSPLAPQNDPTTRTLVGSTVSATLPERLKICAPSFVCVKFATEEVFVSNGHSERLDRPPRV